MAIPSIPPGGPGGTEAFGGAGAGAAAAGLDAEQVVEQGDDEVVVQVPGAVADAEGDDGQPPGPVVAEDLDGRHVGPAAEHVPPEVFFAGGDQAGADRLFEGEDQPSTDGLHDRRGPAFFAGDWVVEVGVAGGVDEGDGAAAGNGRHRVADQVAAHDQDAGGLRAAGELVRGQEYRVLVVTRAGAGGADADRNVRAGGGVVPERQGAVRVQQRGDRAGVGEDAGRLFTAAVAPDPQKMTRSSSAPPTASWMICRASSRSRVVCSPVPELSVWVLHTGARPARE
jgi:hypothetical protein